MVDEKLPEIGDACKKIEVLDALELLVGDLQPTLCNDPFEATNGHLVEPGFHLFVPPCTIRPELASHTQDRSLRKNNVNPRYAAEVIHMASIGSQPRGAE